MESVASKVADMFTAFKAGAITKVELPEVVALNTEAREALSTHKKLRMSIPNGVLYHLEQEKHVNRVGVVIQILKLAARKPNHPI